MEIIAASRHTQSKPGSPLSWWQVSECKIRFFFFLIKHNGTSKCYFSWELSQVLWRPSIVPGSGWEEQPPPGQQNPDPIPNTQLPPGESCYWSTRRLRKGWKYSVQGGLPEWDLPHTHPITEPSDAGWLGGGRSSTIHLFVLQHNSAYLKLKPHLVSSTWS